MCGSATRGSTPTPVRGGTDGFIDRNRFRYRLRFGAAGDLLDNFEAGFRLTSSEAASGGVEGDPISGNTHAFRTTAPRN